MENELSRVVDALTRANAQLEAEVVERRRSERRLTTEHAVTRSLAESVTLTEAAPRLLRAIGEGMGWAWGALWTVGSDANVLRCSHTWHAPSLDAREFDAVSRETTFARGQGIVGRVWQRGELKWLVDASSDRRFLRAPAAARAGLHGAIFFPVLLGHDVQGVIEFLDRTVREPDAEQLEVLAAIGSQVGQFIERMRAEQAVRESDARKAAILHSALDCIVTIDHEGCITEFNPAAERTFGYRRDEVVGQQLADVIIPASLREDHRRGLARYLTTGETRVLGRRVEMMAVRADGSEFPVELAITRIPLDGPPSFTGYLRDITERRQSIDERKRAETRLAGEKRFLEMVASGCSLPDVLNALCSFVEDTATECHCGIYLIDWTGPTFRNGAAPTLPADFNDPIDGLPVRPEIGPCARAACLKTQVIAADVESDPLWQASPFRALALAHGLRSCWSTPIYSLAGHVLGTFAIYQRKAVSPTPLQQDLITQITHIASIAIERAQSEAALKRSQAFLAEGQRLSLTGSFSWRVATDEITASEQSYRILEIDPATPVTFELLETRIHPEDAPAFKERVERARRDGDDFEFEYRLLMPDRSVKYLHVVAHATRARHGHLEYIGALQDVTERRLSEDALGRVRSELAHVARVTTLGALTASIAHEVNQPLSGIITNASTSLRMLAQDPPDVDGARETARRTIRDANRAADVIARLRALFGKKGTAAESVDLNEATREVVALSWRELQRDRVIVRTELSDDLPPVTGDRVQLQQVVLNLLLNASEAMSGVDDRPRQLVIRTERDGDDRVRLSLRDAGVGLDPHNLARLFDAFYTTKTGGMGIGLSVSRAIIERHHGRLWAAPNDGPGATFAFAVPRVIDATARHEEW